MARTSNSTSKKTSTSKPVKRVKKEESIEPIKVQGGMSDMVKGIIVGSVVTGLISVIIILLLLAGDNKTTSNSEAMKKFYEYFNSKEAALIVFATEDCGYCQMQKPIVETIMDLYDFKAYYMELNDYTTAEVNEIVDLLKLNGSTPASAVVKNGEVVKSWRGFTAGPQYVSQLVAAGVLPKGSTYKPEENLTTINYTRFKELLSGSSTSAIILDQIGCETCNEAREFLSDFAKENNIPIFHLSAINLAEADSNDLVGNLGKWGYKDSTYVSEGKVDIPLIMFVKNGKIVDYHVKFSTSDKQTVTNLFKKNGLVK